MYQESQQWLISSKTFPVCTHGQTLRPTWDWHWKLKIRELPKKCKQKQGRTRNTNSRQKKLTGKKRGILDILNETVHTGRATHLHLPASPAANRGAKPPELHWWSRTAQPAGDPTDPKRESKIKENKRSNIKAQMIWAPASMSSF